jgi:hypothetical protein
MSWKQPICLAGITAAAVLALPAAAAEWAIEPSVTLRQEYNDNMRLTTQPHNAVWGTILSPSLKLSTRTEVSEIALGGRLGINRYSGDASLNREDQYYTLHSSLASEHSNWGLDASYSKDSTLVSELDATGVVQAQRQRGYLTVSPSWTYQVNERNGLRLDYQYAQARYEDPQPVGLINYSNQSASASWLYQLSERDQLTASVYQSRFDTSPHNYDARTNGVQGAWRRDFSETMQASVSIGMRNTKSTIRSQAYQLVSTGIPGLYLLVLVPETREYSSSGSVLKGSLTKRFERSSVVLNLSRDVNPSGNGSLVETDTLSLDGDYRFSETLRGSVNFTTYRSRYLGEIVTGNDRRYLEITPRLSWRMTEWWTLDAGYRYSRQNYTDAGVRATSNLVYVGLSYIWPKISYAR